MQHQEETNQPAGPSKNICGKLPSPFPPISVHRGSPKQNQPAGPSKNICDNLRDLRETPLPILSHQCPSVFICGSSPLAFRFQVFQYFSPSPNNPPPALANSVPSGVLFPENNLLLGTR